MRDKEHWLNLFIDFKKWPRTMSKTTYKAIQRWLRIARNEVEKEVEKQYER